MKSALVAIIAFISLNTLYYEYIFHDNQQIYLPCTAEWVTTVVEVHFNDGSKQRYKIDVHESIDNIRIKDGNLSYMKSTKKVTGVVAYTVELASFVKKYIVLKSEFKKISK